MLDTYDLITRSYFQEYLGLSATQAESYNPLLENIIQAVSDRLENYCNVYFIARDLKEYYPQTGNETIILKNAPIISISGIFNGRKAGLTIKNATSTSVRANCYITESGTLKITNSPGSTTSFDLTSSSYDTIGELVTGINLISGWTATAIASTNTPSTDLVSQSVYCYNYAATLGIVDAPLFDYEVDESAGVIYRTHRMSTYPALKEYKNQIRVDYTAGYSTTKDGLPDDVKLAACMLGKRIFDKSKINSAVQSETIGKYSYSTLIAEVFKGNGEQEFLKSIIGHYKRQAYTF